MKCPKCSTEMESVTYQSIEVDRCPGCQGIWFDAREADKLKEMKGSEAIDTGDSRKGKVMNKVDRIECPICQIPLIRMVDPRQHHLWFESCKVCHGVFFDAGEFKDYKEKTILDLFRDWATKERK